jgi:hypothetical protein
LEQIPDQSPLLHDGRKALAAEGYRAVVLPGIFIKPECQQTLDLILELIRGSSSSLI